ncbi:MAG: energy transducer TonB [Ignavibacteriae bacterium]|nr:MAG: energy transducer TonB [Ignavibacteriota bacterium]
MTTHALNAAANMPYGAVELKKYYQKYLRRGLELAIIVHIILISLYLTINYIDKLKQESLVKQQQQQRIINLTDLEPPPSATDEEEPPPKEIQEILSAPPKDLTALTPEPVAKEKAEEQTIKTQAELEAIKTPVSSSGDSAGKYTYSGPTKVEEKKIEEKVKEIEKKEVVKETYKEFEVEKPPECVNLSQVRAMMDYPEAARSLDISGKVTAKVLVGTDGSVIKVGGLTGPDVFYSEVSEKCMNLQFTPGLQNGHPVKVWVTVPFNFKLKN